MFDVCAMMPVILLPQLMFKKFIRGEALAGHATLQSISRL